MSKTLSECPEIEVQDIDHLGIVAGIVDEIGTVTEASLGIGNYIDFYNNQRPHQSLNYLTSAQVHFG